MALNTRFLKKPLTLIVALLYFAVFLFSTIASDSKSTFMSAWKERFTKTPYVLTFGEQLMNFVNLAAPLLLCFAFVCIFLLIDRLPVASSTILVGATLVTLCGITVFVCLNTYNIIETFNAYSKVTDPLTAEAAYSNLDDTLVTLISYHVLLIVYAGSLAAFALGIKNASLGKLTNPSSAFAFAIANVLLALWHLRMLIAPAELTKTYLNTQLTTSKTDYLLCDASNALCFMAVAVFAVLYFLSARNKEADAA